MLMLQVYKKLTDPNQKSDSWDKDQCSKLYNAASIRSRIGECIDKLIDEHFRDSCFIMEISCGTLGFGCSASGCSITDVRI